MSRHLRHLLDEPDGPSSADLYPETEPCPRCGETVVWDEDPGCDSCGLILGDADARP